MKSLVVNLITECSNLENEVNLLINGEFSQSNQKELDRIISSLKSRIVTVLLSTSKLLTKYRELKEIELGDQCTVTSEELIVSAVGNLLLNSFLRISLSSNCNSDSCNVIWNKLAINAEGSSALQVTFRSLLDKVLEMEDE